MHVSVRTVNPIKSVLTSDILSNCSLDGPRFPQQIKTHYFSNGGYYRGDHHHFLTTRHFPHPINAPLIRFDLWVPSLFVKPTRPYIKKYFDYLSPLILLEIDRLGQKPFNIVHNQFFFSIPCYTPLLILFSCLLNSSRTTAQVVMLYKGFRIV